METGRLVMSSGAPRVEAYRTSIQRQFQTQPETRVSRPKQPEKSLSASDCAIIGKEIATTTALGCMECCGISMHARRSPKIFAARWWELFSTVFCVLLLKIFANTRRRPEMKRKKSTAKRFLECRRDEASDGRDDDSFLWNVSFACRCDGRRLWVGFQRDRLTDEPNRSNSLVFGANPVAFRPALLKWTENYFFFQNYASLCKNSYYCIIPKGRVWKTLFQWDVRWINNKTANL